MKKLKDYEFYKTQNGILYCGNNEEVIQLIKSKIDFCFTDPPYNCGKDYGEYKDNLKEEDYRKKMEDIFLQLKTLTENRMCVYPPINKALFFWNMLGEDYRQIILTYSMEGAIRWGFVNQHSFLLTNVKPVIRTKNVWHNVQFTGMGYFFKEDTYGHPGYTSEDVTDRIISSFTKEKESVIDCFNGSGTTSLSCEKLNRNWIGIEISQEYCKTAVKRIEKERKQTKMFQID